MSFLLDTDVLSEPAKPRPHPGVLAWLNSRDESSLFISALTLGEIHAGIAALGDGARRRALQGWVDGELSARFFGRILPVDETVAARWGRLAGTARARGDPLPVVDSLIAATALAHGLTVVTRNSRDIARCGAPVLDPWA